MKNHLSQTLSRSVLPTPQRKIAENIKASAARRFARAHSARAFTGGMGVFPQKKNLKSNLNRIKSRHISRYLASYFSTKNWIIFWYTYKSNYSKKNWIIGQNKVLPVWILCLKRTEHQLEINSIGQTRTCDVYRS